MIWAPRLGHFRALKSFCHPPPETPQMKRLLPSLLLLALTVLPALGQQQVEISADLFTIEEDTREAVSPARWSSSIRASMSGPRRSSPPMATAAPAISAPSKHRRGQTRDQGPDRNGRTRGLYPRRPNAAFDRNVEVVNSSGTCDRANSSSTWLRGLDLHCRLGRPRHRVFTSQ